MKKDILKIAGVKSEKEFYEKFPTEEAFMKVHGKAFKKAAMGKSMVKEQAIQLTDFSNPPQAEVGDYIGGDANKFSNVSFGDIYKNYDQSLGVSNLQKDMQSNLDRQKKEQQQSQGSSGGGGGIDPAQAMQLAAMLAKYGKKIKKYQGGGYMQYAPKLASVDPNTGMVNSASGFVTKQQTQQLDPSGNVIGMGGTQQPQQPKQQQDTLAKTAGGNLLDKGVAALGPLGQPLGQVIKAGRQVKQSLDRAKEARQMGMLSNLSLQTSALRPEQTKRRYVRPEDSLVQPGQVGNPYGTGSNLLQMQEGGAIGGNPTELQNLYNPGTLYSDLGYEPLNDSNQVKQYKKGGRIAQGGMNINPGTMNTLGAIGKTAAVVGDVASGIIDMGTEHRMKQNMRNIGQAAFQSGAQSLQGQNAAYMEEGGWVSHDWQPQVITKFGDYDVKDLLAPDKTMDTLRAGGHLKAYTEPSEEALKTYAMGGDLKTHWGGEAEVISENPYLPDGGETVMFRGQSHDESDGKGRTGIGITYGDSPVEVERGEPAVKLEDGGTGEDNLVVFGNMKIPSYGASELEDKDAKGKKFKHYANHLSKLENKHNKTIKKALDYIDSSDDNDPFSLLTLNSGKAMLEGANAQLAKIAQKKQTLASVQNAILDTAEEHGLDSDALSQGQIKPLKDSDMAKFGKKLKKGQPGLLARPERDPYDYTQHWKDLTTNIDISGFVPTAKQIEAEDAAFRAANPETISSYNPYSSFLKSEHPIEKFKSTTDLPTAEELKDIESKKKNKLTLDKALDAYNKVYPYVRPGIKNPLSPSQFMPEMYALSSNQLEPVQAQTFTPMLEEMPSISFQDQLNEIQAQTNAAMRMAGNNPAAQAAIAAGANEQKSKVLAEQFRTNQMLQAETRRRNQALINEAKLKNLAIFDEQYVRQATAKAKTKAQAQEALSSIADKIARNKAETLAANVTANMYPQYSWGPKGRIYSTGLMDWNIPTVGSDNFTDSDKQAIKSLYEKIVDKSGTGEIKNIKERTRTMSKNGSIVKAIKNL